MTARREAADTLERSGVALSLSVIARMYEQDAFWMACFGAAGRRHADSDAGRHIEHLVTSLRADSSSVFVGYARWLQSVLTTRGMCTRHIEDNFALLAEEIRRAAFAGADEAASFVLAGRDALTRTEGPAARLFRERGNLVERLAAETSSVWAFEIDHLVVYVADALAQDASTGLDGYVRILRRLFDERGLGPEPVERILCSLRDALGGVVDAETARVAARWIDASTTS